MGKAGLDIAMGIVGVLGGPLGFAISTIYFLVDTGITLGTNGEANILDMFLPIPRPGTGRLTGGVELLLAPTDNTRVAVPRLTIPPRAAPRNLSDILLQTPVAAHNAVFRPAAR